MTTTAAAPVTAPAPDAMAGFVRTTSRVGTATMLVGLLLSLAGPAYLYFFTDLGVTPQEILKAYVAVALVFGVLWIVEPLSYFPVLGSSAMYQAFMIGNISNKLLPAALMAQSRIGAKPGTHRGSLSALMAICGAAAVHLASLLVFVGILGTWLISIIPVEVIGVIRLYVFPAVIGAVIVQSIYSMRQLRPTLIAFAVVLVVQFVVIPLVPALALAGTAISVIATIIIGWFLRVRPASAIIVDDEQS